MGETGVKGILCGQTPSASDTIPLLQTLKADNGSINDRQALREGTRGRRTLVQEGNDEGVLSWRHGVLTAA